MRRFAVVLPGLPAIDGIGGRAARARSGAGLVAVVLTVALGAVGWAGLERGTGHGPVAADLPAAQAASPTAASRAQAASRSYGRIPLAFVPNRGQTDARVRFEAQGGGASMFFGDRKLTLAFSGHPRSGGLSMPALGTRDGGTLDRLAGTSGLALDLNFVGAAPGARPRADVRGTATVNYLHGANRADWRQGVPTYAGLSYAGLWRGIDMAGA